MRRLCFACLSCFLLSAAVAWGSTVSFTPTARLAARRPDVHHVSRRGSPAARTKVNRGSVLFGRRTIAVTVGESTAGLARAFPYHSRMTGTVFSIRVYVARHSRAKKIVAGLYSDAHGQPGSRLTTGSVTSPKAGNWSAIPVAAARVKAGRMYWIVLLGKGGTLYFRHPGGRQCTREASYRRTMSALPMSWNNGTASDMCPISAYVTGTAAAALTHAPIATTTSSAGSTTSAASTGGTNSTGVGDPAPTDPTSVLPTLAPVNSGAPVVTGTAQEGQTLTTSDGSWLDDPTSYSYQWQDCDSTGIICTDISGATSASYTLEASDVGDTIRAVVTAANAGGSTAASSGATAVVTTPPPPSNTALPSISGSTVQGQTLSTANGTWTGSPTSDAYQWQDCNSSGASCTNITGATSANYTLTSADVSHTIRAVVTAANAGGSTAASSGATAVVTTPPPPSNTALPSISGSTVQGQTLSTTNGTWTGSPTSYAYQWQDCNSSGASCTNITGATSASYTLEATDVGDTIRAVVTATNAGGSTAASSGATAVVTTPPSPSNTALPTISGSTVQGQTLTTTNGSWNNNPTSYTYQWKDCSSSCTNISGATSVTYTLQSSDVGDTIESVVTAHNAGGATPATSAQTATVTPLPPSNTAPPAISGSTVQGQTLTTTNGSWNNDPTSYTYQWKDCSSSCTNISGATSVTYTLQSSDVGDTIESVVTAHNAGGATPATSAQTATVTPLPPSNTAPPAISGSTVQGQTLTTTNGSWNNNPTSYTYQWKDCSSSCTNISGATSVTYTLQSSDVGDTIESVVTAHNAGGATPATSAQTAAVSSSGSGGDPNVPANTAQPSVSGDLEQGQVLTTTSGSWSNSPTFYTYQWEDCNLQGQACTAISGATASTYTLQASDKGSTLRAVVTASNASGAGQMYSGATAVATGTCSESFTSSNAGSSPYPGANVQTALASAPAGTVICLSGNVGQIDLYSDSPAGEVYIEPGPGSTQTNTTATFDINGANGGDDITVENMTSGGLIHCADGPSGCSIAHDDVLNTIESDSVFLVEDPEANSGINILRNTSTANTDVSGQGVWGVLATYTQQCPDGVTIAHNVVNATAGDGIDSNNDCGTQIDSNVIENVTQTAADNPFGVECGEHCDGWQDNGGSNEDVLDGNLFYNDTDCFADLPSNDTYNVTFTNNVCADSAADSGYWAQFVADVMTFNHNTVTSTVGCQTGNSAGGDSFTSPTFTNNIEASACTQNKGQSVSGTVVEDYNLCPPGGTWISCNNGSHDIVGSPTFVGGADPGTNWTGYQLAASSPGHDAASDGTDMGVSPSYFSVGTMTSPSGKLPGVGG